jgi:hypothetical protein
MPCERDEWPSRVKAIERECSALRLAAARLLEHAEDDPNILSKDDFRIRDVGNADCRLEGTYLIRLFAEFETGLRLYWDTVKDTHPKTEDLMNGVGSRRKISHNLIKSIHQIRDYRNSLVHDERMKRRRSRCHPPGARSAASFAACPKVGVDRRADETGGLSTGAGALARKSGRVTTTTRRPY